MLRESLSPLESSMRQMGELLDAEQEEITFLLNELGKIYNRLYVKSADITGIRYWEDEYAIPHNDDLTIEQRRARVLAKINSSITATKKMLEDLVKQVLGANSVTIIEYPDEYRFVIYVDTKIFEENMKIADDAVDEARHCPHLSISNPFILPVLSFLFLRIQLYKDKNRIYICPNSVHRTCLPLLRF